MHNLYLDKTNQTESLDLLLMFDCISATKKIVEIHVYQDLDLTV